jgi:hypothetical protein
MSSVTVIELDECLFGTAAVRPRFNRTTNDARPGIGAPGVQSSKYYAPCADGK